MTEANSAIDDDTLDLVELSQMGSIQSLIPEHSIDGEVLHGSKLFFLCLVVEHLGADGCGMRTQDILESLLFAPAWTISDGTFKSMLVSLLDSFQVLGWDRVALGWVGQEESVVHVTSWMTLRLEKRIEIPERTLNPSACRHLIESH
jgi:hypothetical protein